MNVDKLVASAAHELRNPINGILGIIKLALQQPSIRLIREKLVILEQNCDLMLSVVNSFLDIQLIKNSKLTLKYTTFALSGIISQVNSLFAYLIEEKHLYLKFEVDSDVNDIIVSDRDRLL